MRVWVCWMVSILILLSSVADVLPLPAASALARPTQAVSCRCNTCQGGRSCCCKTARTALQAALLKARCDSPQPAHLAAVVMFPAILVSASSLFRAAPVNLRFSRLIVFLCSRVPVPLVNPPRPFAAYLTGCSH